MQSTWVSQSKAPVLLSIGDYISNAFFAHNHIASSESAKLDSFYDNGRTIHWLVIVMAWLDRVSLLGECSVVCSSFSLLMGIYHRKPIVALI